MPKILYDAQGFPVFDKNAGWKDEDTFQAAALNDMARKQQSQQTPQEQQLQQGDPYAKKVANILPMAGGAIGALIPGGGETGLSEVGGAAAGTALKNILRSKWPETYGENPTGLQGAGDIGSDLLFGSLPGLMGAMGKLTTGATKMAGSLMGKTIASHINDIVDGLEASHPIAKDAAKAMLRLYGVHVKSPASPTSSEDTQSQATSPAQ